MASEEPFRHPSLDGKLGHFRTIKLDPPQAENVIRCKMLTFDLEDETTSYVALSYMWGTNEPTETIFIGGISFKVRSNLAQFLVRAQHWNLGPIFIDALCINQTDINERNQQVKQMGQIYAKAQKVICWLGHGNEQVEAAIPFIKQFFPLSNGLLQSFYKGKEDKTRQAQQPWQAVHLFSDLQYWFRVWMVQEILKARSITFIYGDESIEGEDLFQFSQELRETNPCPAPLADRLFQSRLFSYLDSGSTKPFFQSGSVTQAKLVDVLWEYSLSACGEKLDRVYALLALAREGPQFPVDYGTPLTELYLQTWQYRPKMGSHLMAFAKHMVEALLDSPNDVDESKDAARSKSYRFQLHPTRHSQGSDHCHMSSNVTDNTSACRVKKHTIEYQLACDGPLQALRTRAWPFFRLIHPQLSVTVNIDQIKNQAFEDEDAIFNIENSGLLVVGRRSNQNAMQIVAKLALSAGLDHSDGTAEITARWLPWSPLLEKLKSKYQAYSVEVTNDEAFLCFNELSLRSFMTGISYERNTIQILRGEQQDAFEVDLLSLHWSPLPMADFSLNEVAMLQDVCDHSSRTRPASSPISVSRAIHALIVSRIDLAVPDVTDEKALPWRDFFERDEGTDGPTASQLQKVFY